MGLSWQRLDRSENGFAVCQLSGNMATSLRPILLRKSARYAGRKKLINDTTLEVTLT